MVSLLAYLYDQEHGKYKNLAVNKQVLFTAWVTTHLKINLTLKIRGYRAHWTVGAKLKRKKLTFQHDKGTKKFDKRLFIMDN